MALFPLSHSSLGIFEDPFFQHGMESRFGLGLLPSDFRSNRIVPRHPSGHHLSTGYRRPWTLVRQEEVDELDKDMKICHIGKDGFQVMVDVHHFKPSEITVKTVDNTVVIEGKHEEREDGHGSVLRHFVRKYTLPTEYDMNTIHSQLSSDGILAIKAPPPAAITSGERHVQVHHTNAPAHLSVKDNKPHKENVAHPHKENVAKVAK